MSWDEQSMPISASRVSAAASKEASKTRSTTAGAAGATAEGVLRRHMLGGVLGELSVDTVVLEAVLIGAKI